MSLSKWTIQRNRQIIREVKTRVLARWRSVRSDLWQKEQCKTENGSQDCSETCCNICFGDGGSDKMHSSQFIFWVWKSLVLSPSVKPVRLWSVLPLVTIHSPGQTERCNQELKEALRCIINNNPSSWSKHLIWTEYAHNTLTSSATGLSPFEDSLGYSPPLFLSQESDITLLHTA